MSDPITCIIAAALLGTAIGVFGTALYCSAEIRRARRESWLSGVRTARRDNESSH